VGFFCVFADYLYKNINKTGINLMKSLLIEQKDSKNNQNKFYKRQIVI